MKGQVSLIKELELSPELGFRPEITIEFLQQYIKKFPEDEVVAEPLGFGQKAKAKLQAIHGGARSLVLVLVKVAQAMNPLISVFLPRNPEYAIPYAFLKIMLAVSRIRLRLACIGLINASVHPRNTERQTDHGRRMPRTAQGNPRVFVLSASHRSNRIDEAFDCSDIRAYIGPA
jgi:hypothetical protein